MPISEQTRHLPPPVGYGLFWAMRQDWRGPALFGLLFVALTVAVLTPHFAHLAKNQERTFAQVLDYLEPHGLREPPSQKASTLSNADGVFYWRGVVWKQLDGEWRPHLFAVKVDAAKNHELIEARLIPYSEQSATELLVFTEITR